MDNLLMVGGVNQKGVSGGRSVKIHREESPGRIGRGGG